MLYEQWQLIARDHRSETALWDFNSGRTWTFAALAAEAERPLLQSGPLSYPEGTSPEFVFSVLQAWRSGRIVCPLEAGQQRPVVQSFPKQAVHLKTTSATTGSARLVAISRRSCSWRSSEAASLLRRALLALAIVWASVSAARVVICFGAQSWGF